MRNRKLREVAVEFGTLTREVFVEADPEVVFAVVSDPDHVKEWWPDEARYEAVVGATGEIVFADPSGGKTVAFTVTELDPPRLFGFRWTHGAEETAAQDNSLHVTFALEPRGSGTQVTMTETGFRERGWSDAIVEETYRDHVSGWDHFLPRLVSYAPTARARA